MASAGIQYFLSSGDCLSFGCVFILLLAKILIAFFFHRCTQSRLVCVIQKKKDLHVQLDTESKTTTTQQQQLQQRAARLMLSLGPKFMMGG